MPRALLANEFGSGRGHLVTLAMVGHALGEDFDCDAALGRREHAGVLDRLGVTVFDGPCLMYNHTRRIGPGGVPTATWGEFLGDIGFDSIDRIRELVNWWREVLVDRRVALVVADYAPMALLAARSLGLPTIATGQGYGLPPSDMEVFPVLDPEIRVLLHDEKQLLSNVNTVAAEIGLTPLKGLSEVYHATLPLVQTLPMLDPYRDRRRSNYLLPVANLASKIAEGGSEVFVYFSTVELESPEVLQALEALPLPRRGYFPSIPSHVAERLCASGMILEPAPVSVDLIASRSRLILNAGQHGILCLGLFAGLPQVALPQHREQLFHARRAEAAGVATVVTRESWESGPLVKAICAAYADTGLQTAAQQLARALRLDVDTSPENQLAKSIGALKNWFLSGA